MNQVVVNESNKQLFMDKDGTYRIKIEIIVDRKFKTYKDALEYRRNIDIKIIKGFQEEQKLWFKRNPNLVVMEERIINIERMLQERER